MDAVTSAMDISGCPRGGELLGDLGDLGDLGGCRVGDCLEDEGGVDEPLLAERGGDGETLDLVGVELTGEGIWPLPFPCLVNASSFFRLSRNSREFELLVGLLPSSCLRADRTNPDAGLPDEGLLREGLLLLEAEPVDILDDAEPRSGVPPLMRVSESAADQRGDFLVRGDDGMGVSPGVEGRDRGEDGGLLIVLGRVYERSACRRGVASWDLAPLELGSSEVLNLSRL